MIRRALNEVRSRLRRAGGWLRSSEAEFLTGVDRVRHAPPPIAAHVLLIVVVGLFTAGGAWAYYARIDIVTPSQGQIVPSSRIKKIQAPEQAVIERILVQEGERVEAGQPLVHLDRAELEAERAYVREQLATARANAARFRALLSAGQHSPGELFAAPEGLAPALVRASRALAERQWHAHQRQLRALKQKRASHLATVATIRARFGGTQALQAYIDRRAERLERLASQQAASASRLDEARQERVKGENELEVLRHELEEARSKALLIDAQIQAETARFRSEKQRQLAKAERKVATLRTKLAKVQARLERHTLRAPIAGIVNDLSVHTESGVVKPAQTLMRIVPEHSPLEVRAKVRNRDIGFVRPGQRVKVKVAAFKFTKYGSIPGTITKLSRSSTPDQQMGSVYFAQVELDRSYMDIDGQRMELVPGMEVTVDVNLGQRRVIEYITSPILRYKDEALRER